MSNHRSPTVCVIGGGITGLVAARTAAQHPGARVILLEESRRLGGKIRTDTLNDTVVEAGPDSFLAREPWGTSLCEEIGLRDRLIAPAVFGAHIWSHGKLRRLPQGWPYGFPASPFAGARTGVLSLSGALRAAGEIFTARRLRGRDVSIGAFVRRRFGSEVLERTVDPVVAGTRAGLADEISLAAGIPQIDSLARKHRSLILGLRAARREGTIERGPPPFAGIRGGMERLVEHLANDMSGRVEVHTAARVEFLRRSDKGYSVLVDGAPNVYADGVVVSVPAFVAARVLKEVSRKASSIVEKIQYASVAVVTLLYPRDAFRAPSRSSGVLVPSSEQRAVTAATWFSTKWPEMAPDGGRAIVRCFLGRTGRDPVLNLDDERLAGRAITDVGAIVGAGQPEAWGVVRWERALPQYEVGHLDAITRVENELARLPAIAVAGAGYRGSGLSDCIRQGRHAADRLLQQVTRTAD